MAVTSTSETFSTAAAKASEKGLMIILSFLSIYVIWGSTYLAIRYAVETIPPLITPGTQHLCAGSLLLAWALAKELRPTWTKSAPAW